METEDAEVTGKKKREEREMQLATQAENEKLLDKEWRTGRVPPKHSRCIGEWELIVEWLSKWEDDFDGKMWSVDGVGDENILSEGKGKEAA